MKIRIFLAIILASSLSAMAQEILAKINGKCLSQNNIALYGVIVEVNLYSRNTFISDSLGFYSFYARRGDTLKIRYRYAGQTIQREVLVNQDLQQIIETVKFDVLSAGQITLREDRRDPFEIEYLKPLDYRKITGSVEKSLVYSTPATSNNELTSNYNVRGGNYDEN
ncbi:MAG: hypothetical protein FJX80_12780, partial [Bacteroidetes bacterium]|nr:hypothetical protein [Bacteroidota bacterium]